MKSVIIFCVGVLIGSYFPDIYPKVMDAFVESGGRDKIVQILNGYETVKQEIVMIVLMVFGGLVAANMVLGVADIALRTAGL